ncbi:hypothetical protein SprV_0100176300 [Sparganum proliferum]
MVEDGNFISSLDKYVDAFLDTSQDRVKEALRLFPNALNVHYGESITTAKFALQFLSRLERKYQSLQFATPKKLFARQELMDSFSTLSIGNERSANQVSEEQVSALSEYLVGFCRTRLKLLTLYPF